MELGFAGLAPRRRGARKDAEGAQAREPVVVAAGPEPARRPGGAISCSGGVEFGAEGAGSDAACADPAQVEALLLAPVAPHRGEEVGELGAATARETWQESMGGNERPPL